MIDKKGNTKLPFEYEHAEPYSEPTEEWEDYLLYAHQKMAKN